MNQREFKQDEGRKIEDVETGIQFAFEPPASIDGSPIQVCDGLWWIPLPVESSLEYVNVYAIQDGNNLTLVDTGTNSKVSTACLRRALESKALSPFKLNRVIVTHYHPDHIGHAGWLARQGVDLWMSRTCWLQASLLIATTNALPSEDEVRFMRMAGMRDIELEAFKRQSSNRYSSLVDPLPSSFTPLSEGQTLTIGKRKWTIHVGNGHAAEHLTLWSDDLVILGDQVLPTISTNLTVPYSEPDADVVDEWLRSCQFLSRLATNQLLCLAGHNRPFRGLNNRLKQLQVSMLASIDRLKKIVSRSTTAIDCMEKFHGGGMSASERRRRLPEFYGSLTYLTNQGFLERTKNELGIAIFRKVATPQQVFKVMHSQIQESNVLPSRTNSETAPKPDSTEVEYELWDEPSNRTWSRFGRRSLVAAALLMSIGSGLYLFRAQLNDLGGNLFHVNIDSALRSKPALKLASASKTYVQFVEIQELKTTQLPRKFAGTVRPQRASEMGFNRIGIVSEILVDRGQSVEQGAVIAMLNTEMLEASLLTLQAKKEAAAARLQEMIAGPRKQTLQSASNQVNSATAEWELANSTAQRISRLVKIGGASTQELENAITNLKAKEEMQQVARNTLSELQEGTRSEQIAAQKAVLNELQAAEQELKVQLSESLIIAPFRGVIQDRFLEKGAISSPGTPVIRLVESQKPEAWIGVSPEYMEQLQQTGSHQFSVQDKIYIGTLKSILPELERTSRTRTIIFELDTDHGPELFGQTISLEVYREVRDRGFWLPQTALVKGDQGLWGAYALERVGPDQDDEGFILRKRELEVLQVDSDRVYVKGTLKAGDKIVSTGVQRLTPGQIVYATDSPGTSESILGYQSNQQSPVLTQKR
ncbi:efflux RND transporter periplasmic adaptor subunit [Pirellulaceae bacterium SH449]